MLVDLAGQGEPNVDLTSRKKHNFIIIMPPMIKSEKVEFIFTIGGPKLAKRGVEYI